jgi:hypothetical protein
MPFALVRRGPLALLLAMLLAACAQSPKTTLSGTIRDAYSNQPIEGAQVTLGRRVSVPTDAQGKWSTREWSVADVAMIQASGYQSATLTLKDRPEIAGSRALTLTLDATLRPNTLSGVIRDEYTDQPLAGAVVSVSEAISATADDMGYYELDGVPEAFQITVAAPEHDETRVDVNRQTTKDVALRPTTLRGMVVDASSSAPLEGVAVTLGDRRATTDAGGEFVLTDIPPDGELVFVRKDYEDVRMPLDRTTTVDVVMRTNVITGIVRDVTSGAVLTDTTVIATETLTGTAIAQVRTDSAGRYRLEKMPERVFVKALQPGYRRGQIEARTGTPTEEIKLEPFAAKALYVKASVAQSRQAVLDYLDIIDRTELTAMVLDLKSDNLEDVGLIYYDSKVPLVQELKTSADKLDIAWILDEARKRDIYTIARVHIFAHDNVLLGVKPEWYVQDTQTGKPWFADFGIAWLDTYNEEVWDYNIQLAVEAAQLGFDEIQFDYIRFPSDGDLTNARFLGPRDWRNNPDEMYNTVGRFMERAHRAINGAGAYFSVDVFGYVAWEPQPNIGQNLQVMGKYADYVCPMVYPSHFLYGELGLGNPGAHPYEIVKKSMELVRNQLTGEASRAKVRPWLQDFTLIWVPEDQIVRYGPREVRAQIDASEETGTSGWALWDSDNDYTVEALNGPEQ